VSEAAPVHAGLFEDDDDGNAHLLGSRCRGCGRSHFPRAASCPFCGSDDVEAVALSDTGTLWGWTAVTSAPPGYEGPVPFGFGVVELPEGLRVITRVEEPDPSRLAFGMPMKLVVVPLGENADGETVTTYSFSPLEQPSAPQGRAGHPGPERARP
jgi:uncharacterized protein